MRDIKIFHGLSKETLDFIEEKMLEEKYEIDENICIEGDKAEAMYFIKKGLVGIRAGDVKLGELKGGESFGEMSLIDMMKRSATVYAMEKTEVYKFHRKAFYELYKKDLESYTIVITNLAREFSRRLRLIDQRLSESGYNIYI